MNKIKTLEKEDNVTFEDIKHIDSNGNKYWNASKLQKALEYSKWKNFHKVIKSAMVACENINYNIVECFPNFRKTSKMPNGGVKEILDYKLTRYACYLIVQNADPRKEVVALGQIYFAV